MQEQNEVAGLISKLLVTACGEVGGQEDDPHRSVMDLAKVCHSFFKLEETGVGQAT
jgi:hypothetical protein